MLKCFLVTQKSNGFAVRTDNIFSEKIEKLIEQDNKSSKNLINRVNTIMKNSESNAHVLFLFASPILHDKNLKHVPKQLDYRTEFKNIKYTLSKIGRDVRYCKKVATFLSFTEIFAYKPSVLHFSGHGETGDSDSKLGVIVCRGGEK
jgi:hypothetical protein